jgi:hypothetical protein
VQQKLVDRAFEIIAPMLQPGEQPVTATRAVVGAFSSSRLGTVISQSVAGQGLTGAALNAHRKQFVVLTDRRLIFLSQTFMGGPGKTVHGAVPREQFSLAEAKIGVVSVVRIAFGTAGDGVALTFPLVDKKSAAALAEGLRRVTGG